MINELAAYLPTDTQDLLKRWRFRRQVKAGRFVPDEPEIALISQLVSDGDTVIDVGANVGHYTLHLAKCVGAQGRVVAFEPIPQTFNILSSNVRAMHAYNVTLLNMAASSARGSACMDLPTLESGLENYYQAAIGSAGRYRVMCMPIDDMQLPEVKLIKIDAEGHDWEVLKGAEQTIMRSRPTLVVEIGMNGPEAQWLRDRGYTITHLPGSPNVVGSMGALLADPRLQRSS